MDANQLLGKQTEVAQKLAAKATLPEGAVLAVAPEAPKIPENLQKQLDRTPNQLGRGRGIK